MVEKTCYDEFIKVVNSILEECINDASHFAQEIAEFLQNWFKSYAEKDMFLAMSNKEEYSSHCIEIAKGTLSIFETLIHFVRNGH